MWLEFLVVSLALCALLLVPGFLSLRALGMGRVWSVCCSPLVSLALLALLGQTLDLMGVRSLVWTLLVPLVAAPGAALAITRARGARELSLPRIEPWLPLVYVALGIALGYNLYVSRLGTPDALFQAYDLTQHLDLIQSMADSGRLTSLGTSAYLAPADAAIAPVDLSGFYPSGWHALCATAMMLTGAHSVVTINASMLVLPCLAFPLGVLALLACLFPERRAVRFCGALVCLAFVAFPWSLIAFGPVYPNVAGFSLAPAAMVLFVHLLGEKGGASERVRTLAALLVCSAGLALCHPNVLFTCVVLLSPYVVHRICDACNARALGIAAKLGASAGFVALVAAVWVVCYHLPFMESTVTHVWPPYAWAWQEIVNILTLSYTFGFNVEIAAQPVLALLVIFGLICAALSPGRRWLVVSYLIACYILLISVTHKDEYKQLLAGFWYTDPMRLASTCVIAAIPLASLGMTWVHDVCLRLVAAYNAPRGRAVNAPLVACAIAALFLVVNFMPEFNLAGTHYVYTEEEIEENEGIEKRDWRKTTHTTFGDYRALAGEIYTYDEPLDTREREFAGQVADLVEDDALIINNPMDGSFLTYGTNELRVYYRNFVGLNNGTETLESKLIRLRLDEYATNERVREAVEAVEARYVLVLRVDEEQLGFVDLRGDYNPYDYAGISSITEDTEGFELVARMDGNLSLYRILR